MASSGQHPTLLSAFGPQLPLCIEAPEDQGGIIIVEEKKSSENAHQVELLDACCTAEDISSEIIDRYQDGSGETKKTPSVVDFFDDEDC